MDGVHCSAASDACFVDPSTGEVDCDLGAACDGEPVEAWAYTFGSVDLVVHGTCKPSGQTFCCQYDTAQWGPIARLHLTGSPEADTITLGGEYKGKPYQLDVRSARLAVVVEGGDGGDTLTGSTVDSPIYTEELSGQGGEDYVYGLDGDDKLRGGGATDHIWGGPGRDTMFGGAGDDWLYGEQGADVIYGQGAHDVIDAGNGDDTVRGGTGNDSVCGGEGDDVIWGGADNDNLAGGPGSDDLIGGEHNDTLSADVQSSSVIGLTCAAVDSNATTNRLHGGPGDDELTGGLGTEVLYGGVGRDFLAGGNQYSPTVFCENGLATPTSLLPTTGLPQVFVGSITYTNVLEYTRGDVGAPVSNGGGPGIINAIYADYEAQTTPGATDFSTLLRNGATVGIAAYQPVQACTQIRSDYGQY